MNRRSFLASASATAVTAGLASCLGGGSGGSDGSGSETSSGDETLDVGGEQVPLVPVDESHTWYQDTETKFVDARGQRQYDEAHITDAVLSPARRVEDWSESRQADPTEEWSTDQRIVCYCRCPHHLSSLRAGELISEGYEDVYAIDEGFWRLDGQRLSDHRKRDERQFRNPWPVGPRGRRRVRLGQPRSQRPARGRPHRRRRSYQMTLHFSDLTPTSPIDLRTPSYELTAPLSELTDGVVNGSRLPELRHSTATPTRPRIRNKVPLHLGEGFSGRVLPVDRVHLAVPHAPRLHDHPVVEQIVEVFVERAPVDAGEASDPGRVQVPVVFAQ